MFGQWSLFPNSHEYLVSFSMAVTAEMLKPYLEGWTLKQIIDARRLFIVDYKILEDLPTKDDSEVFIFTFKHVILVRNRNVNIVYIAMYRSINTATEYLDLTTNETGSEMDNSNLIKFLVLVLNQRSSGLDNFWSARARNR